MTAGPRPFGMVARLGIVVLYGCAAFLLAGRFGDNRVSTTQVPPSQPGSSPDETLLRIKLQASQPVDEWIVRLEGAEILPLSATAFSWSGESTAPLRPDVRLVIAVEAAPGTHDAPLAVRLQVEGHEDAIDRTFWGEANLVEAVLLDPLLSEGGPIP